MSRTARTRKTHRTRRTRRAPLAAALLATASLVVASTAAAADGRSALPGTWVVSNEPGVLPEGIEITPGGHVYVTASGTGDVFAGRLGEAALHVLSSGAAAGRSSALGVHVDDRGRLFVVSPGAVDVLAPDGTLIQRLHLPEGQAATAYINDLVVTADAVYVTDSAQALVWRSELRGAGVGPLEQWLDVHELMPAFQRGWFYLNGIDASPDGSRLLVSAQGLGALVRVETGTRAQQFVTTDGSVFGTFGPDGLLVDGDVARGVLNYGAPDTGQGLYAARLSPDWRTATVVGHETESRSGSPLDTPTTVALARAAEGDRYVVVNSQLDTAPGTPPWTVVEVADPLP